MARSPFSDAAGRGVARWRGQDDQAVDVGFSPDGRYLASAGTRRAGQPLGDRRLGAGPVCPGGRRRRHAQRAIHAGRQATARRPTRTSRSGRGTWRRAPSSRATWARRDPVPGSGERRRGVRRRGRAGRDRTDLGRAAPGRSSRSLTHGGEVYDVSFPPRGSPSRPPSADGLIRIWDLTDGRAHRAARRPRWSGQRGAVLARRAAVAAARAATARSANGPRRGRDPRELRRATSDRS